MKIALLQLNPTVGDLQGNAALIASAARRAKGADLAVTSELALLGYPPRDLLLNADFIERSWAVLRHLAEELADISPLLVGLAESPTDLFSCNSSRMVSAINRNSKLCRNFFRN